VPRRAKRPVAAGSAPGSVGCELAWEIATPSRNRRLGRGFTAHVAVNPRRAQPRPSRYEARCPAAQSSRRPANSGTAAPTSTTASAGTLARAAAATIASGEGAS
jgi:hypothetical protein